MQTVMIPDDIQFADLKLKLESDGDISFDRSVIEKIRIANKLPEGIFDIEDNVSILFTAWYAQTIAEGGPRDPVQDQMIREVLIEMGRGQGFSLPPGRA